MATVIGNNFNLCQNHMNFTTLPKPVLTPSVPFNLQRPRNRHQQRLHLIPQTRPTGPTRRTRIPRRPIDPRLEQRLALHLAPKLLNQLPRLHHMDKPQLEIRASEDAFVAGEGLHHPVAFRSRVAGVAAPFGVLVGVPLREAVEAADASGDGADGGARGEGVAVGVGDVGADGDPWGGC